MESIFLSIKHLISYVHVFDYQKSAHWIMPRLHSLYTIADRKPKRKKLNEWGVYEDGSWEQTSIIAVFWDVITIQSKTSKMKFSKMGVDTTRKVVPEL